LQTFKLSRRQGKANKVKNNKTLYRIARMDVLERAEGCVVTPEPKKITNCSVIINSFRNNTNTITKQDLTYTCNYCSCSKQV
jgi:hypothetical protein